MRTTVHDVGLAKLRASNANGRNYSTPVIAFASASFNPRFGERGYKGY